MRKSMIILLLLIQIIFLFLFSNIHSLLDSVEKIETEKVETKTKISDKSADVIKTVNKIFSYLVIMTVIFIVITGVYFIYTLSSKKKKIDVPEMPQLQNYLFQLKDSEIQLKTLVEKQRKEVLSSEEISRNIINSMDVAVILINSGKRIEIFNKSAERIFNRTFVLAKNSSIEEVLSDYKEIVDTINQNINENRAFFDLVSNNQFFKMELIQMANIGILLLINDITEEKKREIIIQKNRNFIMLGEMAAFMVHEVRNSLGVIFGYTRTINKDIEKIEKVNKEILFLTEMMERFLNFSKPLKGETVLEVDINQMIERIAEKNRIKVSLIGDKVLLKLDAIHLETVFSNLFRNSVEAKASEIWIKIEQKEKFIISIKDNGAGISDNDVDRIWFPFFTTRTKGTGMGLAIVKKSLNYLNGDISLIRSGTEGTEFRIELFQI